MVSPAPDAWFQHVIVRSFEPRLCLITVSVAGQPDFKARDTSAEISSTPELVSPETTHRRQSPPVRGLLAQSGKFPSSRECVVGPGGVPVCRNVNNIACPTIPRSTSAAKRQFQKFPNLCWGGQSFLAYFASLSTRLGQRLSHFSPPVETAAPPGAIQAWGCAPKHSATS